MASPVYRAIFRLPNGTRGPGDVVAELENAKNVGHSEYANDVGEAFLTVSQGDSKLADLQPYLEGVLHMQILRDNTLVWSGWLGELDEEGDDVIIYGYSYVAGLFWYHTDWGQAWTGATMGTIITDAWNRAKTTLSDSMLNWVTTGTIETPVTTSGGSTAIVLPKYEANYKRILFVMQEMAGMAASDTTNRVIFEITPAGVFNFHKNKGASLTNVRLEYGAIVSDYNRIRSPMDRRNVVYAVGSSPHDIVLRRTDEDAADRSANGRREESLFYSWVRDATELERVNKLRLGRALRTDNLLALSLKPNSIVPARASGQEYSIGDMVPVLIDNGITQLDDYMLITGQQVIWRRGVEKVRLIVQDRL